MLRLIAVVGFCLWSVALPADERSATDLLPSTTIAFAEFRDPPGLISTIFDHPLRAKIESLEPWKQVIRTDGYRGFLTGRKFVEIQLGMEWREALETLTEKGIWFGVDAATQGVVILIQSHDAESLDVFRAKLLELTKLGKNPDQIRESVYRDLPLYEANKSQFAVVDDWLAVSNKAETLKPVLDRLIDGGARGSLSENEIFNTAQNADRHAAGRRDATAWAFVNLRALRDAGVAKKLFAGQSENPGAELLVGGILSTLQHADYATAALNASHSGVRMEFSLPHRPEWIPEERSFYFGPDGTGRAPALPETKDALFTLSTYRNFADMWLRAGDLFNEEINDGFAEADAGLTTFFSGKDFGEDILGSLCPEVGFVVTRQDFTDILPKPAIKVPQFALIVDLREPETMTRELRRTFQSMIGFFNVVGAMEGRAQLELDMDKLDNGALLVTSEYVPEPDDAESTRADLIYNFSPSIGFADKRFVVSSTKGLARELVQADIPPRPQETQNTGAKLYADVLKRVLDDNREQLISQNMLEEGHSREEAEAAIGLLLDVIGYIEDVSLSLDAGADELSLRFGLTIEE